MVWADIDIVDGDLVTWDYLYENYSEKARVATVATGAIGQSDLRKIE